MPIHIESEGEGEEVVLLHGWGMHGGCWEAVSKRLSEKFRVHRVDLPGHGSSACIDGDWVDALAVSFPYSVRLCGWSLGGQLAAEWAIRHPQRVSRLALVSSTPRFVACPDWEHGISRESFESFSAGLEEDPDGTARRFLFLQAQGGSSEKALFRELQRNLKKSGIEGLRKGLELLRENDLRQTAALIRQPVLILHGECDRLTPPGAGKWLAETIGHAGFEKIPGCAHAPVLACPDFCAEKLAEFFDERLYD